MKEELMKLPYAYDALEPYFDAKTMEIHHSKHHQTYVDKFNAATKGFLHLENHTIKELLSDWNLIPKEILTQVRNFGGGVENHNFFWHILKKEVPNKGKIVDSITTQWKTFDAFKKEFDDSALSLFGSGWTWLVYDKKAKRLEIMNTHNQDSPLSAGKTPLLTIDVWEHAYYLKYQNKRAEYVNAFWNVINWHKVNELYEEALKK